MNGNEFHDKIQSMCNRERERLGGLLMLYNNFIYVSQYSDLISAETRNSVGRIQIPDWCDPNQRAYLPNPGIGNAESFAPPD